MSYAINKRVLDVREGWSDDQPPAASLIHHILKLRARSKDSAYIAEHVGVHQSVVARICDVDQDIRYFARSRLPASA